MQSSAGSAAAQAMLSGRQLLRVESEKKPELQLPSRSHQPLEFRRLAAVERHTRRRQGRYLASNASRAASTA